MKKALPILLFLCFKLSAFSQINLSHNAMRPGDEVIKQQVEYKDPGRSGEDVIWNFSQLKAVNPEYTLSYRSPHLVGDSVYVMGKDTISKKDVKENELIIGTEHYTMYYYQIKNGSMLCLGHENPVTLLHHKQPLSVIDFPFNYGQEMNKSFESQGVYSSQEAIKSKGNIHVESDAYGIMILPSGDTINHVLRVKSVQNIMENDSLKLTKEKPLNIQLETYRWYAKGYRYPVFETVRSYNIQDTARIESFTTAFFYPPIEHYYLADDPQNLAVIDSLWNEKNKVKVPDPANPEGSLKPSKNFAYNYYPNPVIDKLHIEYMLEEASDITITVFDMNGRQIKTIPQKSEKQGLYNETIDCSSLITGNYILRLQMNQEVVNEKIIKK